MRMKFTLVGWLVVAFTGLLLSTSTQAATFSKMFVFGDSLSDNGNLAAVPAYSFLNNPPFNKGFTNGKFAVEVLAKTLKLEVKPALFLTGSPSNGTNYAVAGARANRSTAIDLSGQTDAFLSHRSGNAPSDALYVVMIGGNDIADALLQPSQGEAQKILASAVGAISTNINRLMDAGAKSFLVVNAPNIGLTPEVRKGGKNAIRYAQNLSKTFNALLQSAVNTIEKNRGTDVGQFDLYNFVSDVMGSQTALGYTNTKNACYDSVNLKINPGCRFNDYFYFDSFHPTATVHRRAGYAMFALAPRAGN